MNRHTSVISSALFVVFVGAATVPPAFAQGGETTSTPAQLAQECQNAKSELAALEKSGNQQELRSEIDAAQQQVILTCKPHIPPPPPLASCGTDTNGAGTAQVNYVDVYDSNYAKWCVDQSVWSSPDNRTTIQPFFQYYDEVVPTLTSLYGVKIQLPIVVEVTNLNPQGTFCDCGPKFGYTQAIRLAYDAFSNTFQNPATGQAIVGWWGYLITVHETTNAFTGVVGGGGWPTDWWADSRSPFPNAMDEEVMRDIGNKQNNATLLAAADAQHARWVPGGPNADPQVIMFVNFFNAYGGFKGYAKAFSLVTKDGIQWVPVGQDPNYTPDHNTSALLSEYVIAYLSMGFGTTTDITPQFTQAGVGEAWPQYNVPAYTVSATAVKAIGNAHCSIADAKASGHSYTSELAALQAGNYGNAIAPHVTKDKCPSECTWSDNKCVVKW